jgi:anthranilate synthase component II
MMDGDCKGIKIWMMHRVEFFYLCVVKILLVDNYDSFTWNLCHYLEQIADAVSVVRNDDLACLNPDAFQAVVISPGPGLPLEAGYTMEVIARTAGKIPLLGVCLGHQAIIEHFGGRLLNLPKVFHGKQRTTLVVRKEAVLFKGLPVILRTGHYHSWVADPAYQPSALEITAVDSEGNIMACQDESGWVSGVQFHPESVMTPDGFEMLRNWITFVKKQWS